MRFRRTASIDDILLLAAQIGVLLGLHATSSCLLIEEITNRDNCQAMKLAVSLRISRRDQYVPDGSCAKDGQSEPALPG
jgi:hypothetical protein